MLGKSRPQHPARGRALVRARARARLHGQARDRLLAHDRGPAAPGQPRDASTAQGTIHLSKTYHNEEPHRRLLRKLKGLLGELGCHGAADPELRRSSTSGSRWPASPTSAAPCASATDPRDARRSTSTARRTTLDNLYVVDTSFFPSSSAVNPALTAMANALRVGRPPARAAGRAAPAERARQRTLPRRWRHEDARTTSPSASERAWWPASPAPRR